RHQKAAQIRANKRKAVIERRRGLDGGVAAPVLVTVISFGSSATDFVEGIAKCDETIVHTQGHNVAYFAIPRFKSRLGFLTPDLSKYDNVLDSIKVSDVVCFLWPTEAELSEEHHLLLTIVKAHGLPSYVNVAPHLNDIPIGKKREDARKHVQALISETNLTSNKLFCSDSTADFILLVRHFIDMKKNKMLLQKRRPHILVEKLDVVDDKAGICSVLATGYLRGPTWNVNHLVHIQGWGDFQLSRIIACDDPNPLKPPNVLATADEAVRESLQSEIVPDPMDAEQTWPDEYDNVPGTRNVPKGTSSYQAAWILDDDNEESAGESDEVEKYRREREDAQFPDEIDTPIGDLARIRFQKYRGLKSFRTSPWDPKENLPSDYARIFQFQNYKKTRKNVLSQIDDYDPASCVSSGQYVTLQIDRVPVTFQWNKDDPLVLYQLLPHEQRMSVLNFVIRKHPSCRVPITNKQKLIFNVGFRKFEACPVFSQHSNGNKFKMERFLPANTACVATVFAPITFPPASVLVFREGKGGKEVRSVIFSSNSLFYSIRVFQFLILYHAKIFEKGIPFSLTRIIYSVRCRIHYISHSLCDNSETDLNY
ncbi:unnamed protein product, partial [Cylicostephanus goldi]